MSGFEAYRNRKKMQTNKGCPRCGKAGDAAGQVVLELRDRTGPKVSMLISYSKSLCEDCCVKTYEELAVFFSGRMKDA